MDNYGKLQKIINSLKNGTPLRDTKARISHVSYYLPEQTRTIKQVEAKIKQESPADVKLPLGMITRVTGVEQVYVMDDDWQTSDLAHAAVTKMVAEDNVDIENIDLLIFASASQDLIEPATSHIVSSKLGLACPVMDVKNACNSFINGIEVANALIKTGNYKRVLVVSGESPSRGIRWNIPSREIYLTSFPGFTMSDAGAAALIESTDLEHVGNEDSEAVIIDAGFTAKSDAWDVGMLPTGGSVNPRGFDRTYFEINGGKLFKAFELLGSEILDETLSRNNISWDDFTHIAVHQVALPYLAEVRSQMGIPDGKTLITLGEHGNIASVSLPLQLKKAQEQGLVKSGDLVALVGLAGGISIGIIIVRI